MSTARGGLLAIQTKKAETNIGLAKHVGQYVRDTYADRGEACVTNAIADLEEVERLRGEILANSNTDAKQAEQLTKYFGILSAMELRFPISKDSSHINSLSFVWWDAFKASKKEKQQNVNFEKCSMLFNLAALHSQCAIDQDRSSSEGLKVACKKFQEAAGVFAYMKEHVSMRTDAPHPLDISPDAAKMLEQLMLAQAQECVYEKAMNEGKSEGVSARLGKQCFLFYTEVVSIINGSPLSSYMDKSWTNHLKSKCLYFDAETQMLMAEAERKKDESQIGSRIARLRHADLKAKECEKIAKNANKFIAEASKNLSQQVAAKLTKAVKDNETVYLERVPPYEQVAAISEAAMVKSVQPQNLNKTSVEVFEGLVPDSSAKVVSKYTELVDDLIKGEKRKLAKATDEARAKLKELELPDLLLAMEPREGRLLETILAEQLREKIAEVNSYGGVKHCYELAQELQGLRNVGTQMLNSAEQELEQEAAEDQNEREAYKEKWVIPASATLTTVLAESIAEFRQKIQMARESDRNTLQQLEQPENPILLLETERLLERTPYLQKPMVSVGVADADTVVSELKKALLAVEKCSAERFELEGKLNDMKFKDNILPQLMSSSDSEENIFKEQLSKYKPLQDAVAASLASQEPLLKALGDRHAEFVSVFGIPEWRASCESFSAQVQHAYDTYKQIQSNFDKGIGFYTSLQDAISQLKQQCSDFCLTRKMQRDDFLRQLAYSHQQQGPQVYHQPPQQPPQQAAAYPPQQAAAYPPPPQYPNPTQQQQPAAYHPPPPGQGYPPPPPPGGYAGVNQHMGQMHISPNGQQYEQYSGYPPPPPPRR